MVVLLCLCSLSQAQVTQKAAMPTARFGLSTSVVDGKIYAIGGMSLLGNAYSTVEMYDPVADTWTKKADMPTARGRGVSTSVVNGKIYAIGGMLSRTEGIYWTRGSSAVEEYDPATDTWTRKANMPMERGYHSSSVVNGKIYVVGGQVHTDKWAMCTTVEEYDPATDTWSTIADMIPIPVVLSYFESCSNNLYTL